MDEQRFLQRIVLSTGLLIFSIGCTTVDLPRMDQAGYQVLEDEQRLFNRTQEMNEQIDLSGVLYQDRVLENYLTTLARSLLPEDVSIDQLNVEVKMINDTIINAYAAPTGRIYINTSMLALMDNEAQLAAVLGHELVHVLHRHLLEVKRTNENQSALFSSLGVLGPFSTLAQISSITGFSQHVELEADHHGFETMLEKGYDPNESVVLFKRIKQFVEEEDINTPLFFSSHPRTKARISNFEKLLEENADRLEKRGIVDEHTFRGKTKKLKLKTVNQWIRSGMFITALDMVDHYISYEPNQAEAYQLKGDILRKRIATKDDKKRKTKDPKDFEDALDAYNQSLALDKTWHKSWLSKGLVLEKLNRTEEAKEAYAKYLELNPDAIDQQYFKNILYEK